MGDDGLNTEKQLMSKLLEINQQDLMAEKTGLSIHYHNRNLFVFEAIPIALRCGFNAGIRIDPKEPEWPVVFIELPTGQISYHLPQHENAWDEHTTQEKRLRILAFVSGVQ
jgi:hypothetical protein